MKDTVSKIVNNIIGSPEDELAHRIVKGMYVIVATFLIILYIISKLNLLDTIFPDLFFGISIFLFVFLYFLSKRKFNQLLNSFVIIVFSFGVITFLWFKISGISGTSILVSISLIFIIHLILNIKHAVYVTLLLLVWIILLTIIDLHFSDFIQNKLSEKDLKISLFITFFLVIVEITFSLVLLRNQYQKKIKQLHIEYLEKNKYKKEFSKVEAIYNILFKNTLQGIGYVSIDETFLMANTAANKIFGINENETLIGRNLREFIPQTEFEKIVLETEKRKQNISSTYLLKINTLDNKQKTIEVNATPLKTANTDQEGTVAIFRDVTNTLSYKKELSEAKQKAEESNRLKSVFLSNLSHEIRTPMNSIIGFAEVIEHQLDDVEFVKQNIAIIKEDAKNLMSVINDIIDVSKYTVGDINVNKDVENMYLFIEHLFNYFKSYKILVQKNVDLLFETNLPTNYEFNTDYSILKVIIKQLLYNALKYTEQGKVVLSCNILPDGDIQISVKDTGIGISEEAQEFIFDVFRQVDERTARRYGGNGIGLTMVKHLCEALDSKINLDSKPNIGSNFWFILKK